MASKHGDYRAQARYNDESYSLFRELGDSAGAADAVTDLGVAMWQQGCLDQAETYLGEGLRLSRELEDSIKIATAALPLASVARDRGDFERARLLYAEAMALSQACGEQLLLAHVLSNLGWLELYAGNLDEARRRASEGLAIRQAFNVRREMATSQTLLGKIAVGRGELSVGGRLFSESLATHWELGNRWGISLVLEGVAVMAATPHPERALRLTGAAHTLRAGIGRPLPPAEERVISAGLEPARQALSAESATQAWAGGLALSETQAVAEARELLTTLSS
jgi:tetratricopeptide (TPR) repeat protein